MPTAWARAHNGWPRSAATRSAASARPSTCTPSIRGRGRGAAVRCLVENHVGIGQRRHAPDDRGVRACANTAAKQQIQLTTRTQWSSPVGPLDRCTSLKHRLPITPTSASLFRSWCRDNGIAERHSGNTAVGYSGVDSGLNLPYPSVRATTIGQPICCYESQSCL